MRSTASPRAVSSSTGTADWWRNALSNSNPDPPGNMTSRIINSWWPAMAAQLESRPARQHDIENYQLMVACDGCGQSGIMVVGGVGLKALGLQKTFQQIDERMVVIDDEQVIHWFHCALSSDWLR